MSQTKSSNLHLSKIDSLNSGYIANGREMASVQRTNIPKPGKRLEVQRGKLEIFCILLSRRMAHTQTHIFMPYTTCYTERYGCNGHLFPIFFFTITVDVVLAEKYVQNEKKRFFFHYFWIFFIIFRVDFCSERPEQLIIFAWTVCSGGTHA